MGLSLNESSASSENKGTNVINYSVANANVDFDKNMLLLKNPQFPPNCYETLPQSGTHESYFVTKFCNDWVKIADFLIKAYFCQSLS